MSDDERERLTNRVAAEFAAMKYAPAGAVADAVKSVAARLGLVPSPEERDEIAGRVEGALRMLLETR